MPRGKQKFDLKFEDVVPKMMELIGAKTYVELSKHLGITPQSITNFKTKGNFPVGLAIKFSFENNVPVESIIPKKGEHVGDHLAVTFSPQKSQNGSGGEIKEMVVPYGLPPRQGIGCCRISLEVLEPWVDELFPSNQRSTLIASIVDSDNMEPTLPMHSMVLIDTSQTNIHSAGIFAFQEEGHLAFRRLCPRLDGNVDVINDNNAYPSQNVPLQSLLENPRLKVAGRVIFVGNKI
jgi:hypothetical protein